jgi:lipopolysaccharide export system permease protein
MIPILWRCTIAAYLKLFFLSVSAFISVLLIARFKEAARFAALSSDWGKTGLFTVYQIPFILPIAIPLSALIASLLLFQKMSKNHELTAFRAAGLSFQKILTPLALTAFGISLFTFSICAELSPYCRRESKALFYRESSANPLLLLQRQQLIKIKDAYLQLEVEEEGKRARDFLLIAHNESHDRLSLLSAQKLKIKKEELLGEQVAIISHLANLNGFDTLLIENQALMSTDAPLLSNALKKSRPHLDVSSLNLRMLRLRAIEGGAKSKGALAEMLRRVSLSLSVFSLTWVGSIFGIEQGRSPSRKGLLYALLLALTVLMSYFLGKEIKTNPLLAAIVYFTPHLLIAGSCLHRLGRIKKGRLS